MLILRGVDDKGATPFLSTVFLGCKCKLSYLLFSGVFLLLFTPSTKELSLVRAHPELGVVDVVCMMFYIFSNNDEKLHRFRIPKHCIFKTLNSQEK